MPNGPSFTNLDEAKSTITQIESQMKSTMESFESQSVNQIRNSINTINNDIENLKNSLKSQNLFESLTNQVEQMSQTFNKLKDTGTSAIITQKNEIQSFMDKIVQMNEALKNSNAAIETLSNVNIGNINAVDEYINKIKELKLSFDNVISSSNIIDFKESDLDDIKSKINNFLTHVSKDGSQILNIANMLMQSANDPAVEMAFRTMLKPLNQLIAEIPQNVSDSFNKGMNNVQGSSGIGGQDLNQLSEALTVLTGKIEQVNNSKDFVLYDPNVAAANRNSQDAINQRSAEMQEIERLWSHVDRIKVSTENAGNVDSGLARGRDMFSNADKQIDDIINRFKNNDFTKKERRALSNIGVNEDNVIGIRNNIQELESYYNKYHYSTNGLQQSVNNYSSAMDRYVSDSSAENLEALIELENEVKIKAELSSKALEDLFSYQKNFAQNFDLNNDSFKKLPKEMQEMLTGVNTAFESNNLSAESLLKLYKTFNIELGESAEKLEESLNNAKDSLNGIGRNGSGSESVFEQMKSSKFSSFANSTLSVLNSINRGIDGAGRTLNNLGFGVGMPTSLNGLTGFINNSTKWYRRFGEQSYDNAMAQVNQGSFIDDYMINSSIDKGIALQRETYGRINYSEYSNTLNSLMTNVQGQYGQDKAQGMQDMSQMTEMSLLLQKIYGVDSVNAVSTFYKELNFGAKETIDILGRLTDNAQAANIPVSQYIKLVSDMGLKFKDLGFDVKLVENGMRNLTMNGVSFSTAQQLIGQTGDVMNRFASTNNLGEMGYYGVMSGAFSDPFEAMSSMLLRWDENGNPVEGASDNILAAIGSKMDMYAKISGGNENLQKAMVVKTLEDMGYKGKTGSMLAQRYLKGDNEGFKELLDGILAGEDVTGEGGGGTTTDELKDKITSASERLDELTKAEEQMISIQQNVARINEKLYDSIGQNWQKMIEGFGIFAENASELVGSIDVLNAAISNLPSLLLGGAVVKSLFDTVLGSVFDKGATKLFDMFKKGGTTKSIFKKATGEVLENVDDVARAAAKNGDDVVRSALGGASKFSKALPIIGTALTVLDGIGEFRDNKKAGKDNLESVLDAGAVVGGSAAGGSIGAAIGSMIFPGIGTAIGAGLGGVIGNFVSKWGVDEWDRTKSKNSNLESQADATVNEFSPYNTVNKRLLTSDPKSSLDKTMELAINSNSKYNDELLSKQKQMAEQQQLNRDASSKENGDIIQQLRSIDNSVDKTGRRIEEAVRRGTLISNGRPSMTRPPVVSSTGSIMENNGEILDGTTSSSGILNPPSRPSLRSGTSSLQGSSVNDVIHKDLSQKTNMTAADIDAFISANAGPNSKMIGMGDAFLKASEESGLDPLYLVSHAALETGWGSSTILNDKNNWFGIGAFDSSPYESAYGFSNLEAGIIEGAKWISKNYTQEGQNTLYSMRFNNGVHEYATDPEWANKIGSIMLKGVNGDVSQIGAAGSGSLGGGSSDSGGGVTWDDLKSGKYDNYKFSSYNLGMGSYEYSNGAQSYNAADYKEYDKDFVYYDAQAMARKQYLLYYGESGDGTSITSARDDRSSAYNSNPQFEININVSNGRSSDYDAFANDLKTALTNVTEQYMGASARITSANYQRVSANY